MDARDERGEGSGECSRRQAVLGFERLGPSQGPGREIDVPDPDPHALQGKPHAVFRRSQCLDRPVPLGDVGAGTERADDASGLVPEHRVVPFDQPFLARSGEHRILGTGQIAVEEGVEILSEPVPDAGRQTYLGPVLPA
jgi:hypothetical protein